MKSKIKMKRENKIKSTINNLDRTPVPKSRPWSLPKAVVLQQLLILQQLLSKNPQKNRE